MRSVLVAASRQSAANFPFLCTKCGALLRRRYGSKVSKTTFCFAALFAVSALCAFAATAVSPQDVKPIRGTWLNLFHQDARNDYTNPRDVDMFSPELWRTKIKEMSGMGIKYLIFLAVANEGKAAYESDFMPPIYAAGQESPVSVIMKTADAQGMKVFMSFGWANNQDDKMSKPNIRKLHLKIMRECARKFGGHSSFYGWYFPCEFSAAPRISDDAIAGVNALAAEARKLSPNAKLMISPYGVHGAVVDEKYAAQLAKLDVDIVAYQDGVGCVFVFEPRVKAIFAKLRWVHNQVPRVALWGNVETFAWEKEGNNRWSALVPAAFPRVLSQMAGVSPYADETISFIVQGMFDQPGSPRPVGQVEYSCKMGQHYFDFLAGKGRWPVLAASFTGNLAHQALGKSVLLITPPSPKYNRGDLTDGQFGVEDVTASAWLGFEKTNLEAVIDLGQATPIRTLAARFLQYAPAGIRLPARVEFGISDNGSEFKPAASVTPETWPHDRHDYWIDMALANDLNQSARYVRVHAVNAGQWLFVDELLVNPAK